jgi:lysophospholipase L1-like esterase
VRPQILLRRIDVDITFPFMRPDRDLMWSPRPGFRGEFQGQTVSINSLGLRGAEPALPKPRTRRRVICFGDSITFGYGVSDTETYPVRLGEALAGHDVDVINAGVTGFTTHQVVSLAERTLPVVQADVATFCIGWNDGTRRPVDDREYVRRLRQTMDVDSVLDHLAIYSFLKARYLRWSVRQLPATGALRRVSLEQYAENLAALVALCRKQGVRPVFIELPRRRGGDDPPADWSYPEAFEAAAGRLGAPLLTAGLLGRRAGTANSEAYFIDSLHLSVEGNRLLGEALARQLVEARLIE